MTQDRLQVLLLPFQAGGPGNKPGPPSAVFDFPMLRAVVELDVGCPVDFKPAECTQGENIGPEALSGSIGVELYRGVHVGCLLM